MNNYLALIPLVITSIILNTIGQTLLKMGAKPEIFNIYLFGGLSAYAISTVFYIIVLSKVNLSVIYPVFVGLTIIATTFSGIILFKEAVTPTHWVGIGLIISGIIAVTFGKIS